MSNWISSYTHIWYHNVSRFQYLLLYVYSMENYSVERALIRRKCLCVNGFNPVSFNSCSTQTLFLTAENQSGLDDGDVKVVTIHRERSGIAFCALSVSTF